MLPPPPLSKWGLKLEGVSGVWGLFEGGSYIMYKIYSLTTCLSYVSYIYILVRQTVRVHTIHIYIMICIHSHQVYAYIYCYVMYICTVLYI